MTTITPRDYDILELELDRYSTINNKIYLRRQELIHNYKPSMERTRSTRVSSPTEATALLLATDIVLRNLELFKETVELFISGLSSEEKEIFKQRWLSKLTWDEIAFQSNTSSIIINRKRKRLLTKYQDTKGL